VAVQEQWTHQDVETNGVRLHCVTQGEGDLVILLHGFPENWYSWRHQIPFLARRFKVVAPDMRGYNLSEKPEGIESYGVSDLTADVKGLIEAFGRDRAHVVGHDWGGAVAWMFSMAYPGNLDKLAVLNCPHPAVFAENLMRNPRQIIRSWYMFFFQLPVLPELAFRSFDYRALKRAFVGWAINKDAFSEADIEELKEAAAKPGALTGGINYYRAMFRNRALLKTRKSLPRIKSPTLVIWAEEDRALGKELTFGMEPYFEDGIEIKYIPDCSHWVQQEQPLLVNQFLDEFL
jgi:pimeloyl-ACP methyl ester carboxylesterase